MRDHPLPSWSCDKCGSRNDEDAVSCYLCDTPRPGTESYSDLHYEDAENDTGIEIVSG